ncbi:GDYXXLXY domain-containing protein [Pasteurella testudinis]|uniref:GDYXXLXY domain-containing protein n=1 Tax=Pasteurella testudinis TaxID=761 RepID=UPI004057DB01
MPNKPLFTASWSTYLLILTTLSAAGFLSSGVVTWIAANWDYFGKFTKLYATQGLFLVSMAAAMVCYYREYRKLGQVRLKFASSSFFFIAAVLIGALLALIGQIYQTGADPWQLFALWSLLQIPLLLALPNVAAALLLLVTCNLSLAFYLQFSWWHEHSVYFMILLNLCFVILSEIFSKPLHDQDWHIISKVSNTILIMLLLPLSSDNAPLVWLLTAGALYYYKQRRHDLFNQSGYWACLLFSVDVFLLNTSDWDIGGVFLATLVTLGAAIALGIHLKKQYTQQAQGMPWPLQILFTTLAILVTLLLIVFLFVADIFESDNLFLMTSLAFLAIGAVLYTKKANEYASGILIMVGLGLYVFHYLFNYAFGSRSDEALSAQNWDLLGMVVISLLCYLFIAINWIKTGSLILLLFTLLYTFSFQNYYLYGFEPEQGLQYSFWHLVFDYYAAYWLALASLVLFCLSLRQLRYHAHIESAAWAFWLVYIGFIAKPDIYISLNILNIVEANPLSVPNNISEFFHILTHSLFTAERWHWTTLILLLICLSPAIIHLWISRRQQLKTQSAVIIVLLLAIFGLAFIASPSILLGFALLLLAYPNHNRLLFGCALLAIIGFLTHYYYWLGLPLLYKSFLLLANAFLFLLAALYLQRQRRRTSAVQTAAPNYQGKIGWSTPSLAVLTLLLTLAIGNFSIQKYENVLHNGKTVILALAPIDPRSIMQGDYMELNYDLLNEVRSAIDKQQEDKRIELNVDQPRTIYAQDGSESYVVNDVDAAAYARFEQWLDQRPTQLYALLKQKPDGTSTLCRLESTLPTDYHDCLADIAIKLHIRDYSTLWNLTMPGQQFFFAEGQAAHFEQAKYGEFRVLNGTALLARLLDSEMKGL